MASKKEQLLNVEPQGEEEATVSLDAKQKKQEVTKQAEKPKGFRGFLKRKQDNKDYL